MFSDYFRKIYTIFGIAGIISLVCKWKADKLLWSLFIWVFWHKKFSFYLSTLQLFTGAYREPRQKNSSRSLSGTVHILENDCAFLYSLCCSIHNSIRVYWNEIIETMNILTTFSDTDSDLNYNLQSNSAEHTLSSEEVQCQLQKSEVLCPLALYSELLGWNESCRKMSGC